MNFKIVDMHDGVVVVEHQNDGQSPETTFAQAITELGNPAVRHEAIKHATASGMVGASCSMPGSPYPVDRKGRPIEDAQGKVHRYRIDIPVQSAR